MRDRHAWAADATGRSADAVRQIVMAANGHSTFPAMCLSMMAGRARSDEPDRSYEPGYHAVLQLCRAVFQRVPDRIRYEAELPQAGPTAVTRAASASSKPATPEALK